MILGLFAVISYSIITVSSGAKSGIENPFTGSYVGCEIPFILTLPSAKLAPLGCGRLKKLLNNFVAELFITVTVL